MAARCILHIEGNADDLRLVRRILEPKGYIIIEARDALSALDIARSGEQVIDLVLLDLTIPQMDGYEVATRLKALPKLQRTPVLALASAAAMGDREKCLVSGCDGYLSKPIDVHKFPKLLEEYLGGRHDFVSAQDEAQFLRDYVQRLSERLEEKIRILRSVNERLETHQQEMASEVQHQAQELDDVHKQLLQQARLAAMGELVAGVSHELGNPTTALRAFVQLMQRERIRYADSPPDFGTDIRH